LSAAAVFAAVAVIILQTLHHLISAEARLTRLTLARERGWSVLSILEPRVLYAACGLTYERGSDVFQRSFGGPSGSSPPPGGWTNGPLHIWQGDPGLWEHAPETGGVSRGRGLAVLYAVPSALKARLDEPLEMTGAPVSVSLIPYENFAGIGDRLPTLSRSDVRSWVTFPLTRLPVHVENYFHSTGKLTVRLADGLSGEPRCVYPYDEMHYLRGERFHAENESLYSEELKTAWTDLEIRSDGVLELWFEWTPAKRLLEAWVLTTGGDLPFGKSARPADWPTEAPWRAVFENHDVAVTHGSWIVPNL
jgi:hypothetical protein